MIFLGSDFIVRRRERPLLSLNLFSDRTFPLERKESTPLVQQKGIPDETRLSEPPPPLLAAPRKIYASQRVRDVIFHFQRAISLTTVLHTSEGGKRPPLIFADQD